MNLVAKEFVAAREDEDGVLVLSEFAGAAAELGEAIQVNPYDVDEHGDGDRKTRSIMPARRAESADAAALRKSRHCDYDVHSLGRVVFGTARRRPSAEIAGGQSPALGNSRRCSNDLVKKSARGSAGAASPPRL